MIPAILTITGLGMAAGLMLAIAAKKFAVEVDPKIEQIEDALPGVNCGACGYGGCSAYAKSIVEQGEEVNLCTPGGEEATNQIATIMGVEADAAEKIVAVIHCAGDNRFVEERFEYRGLKTCVSAHLTAGGPKQCSYGCLGYGDCAAICPYDAIKITAYGLAVVDPEKCVGCKQCVDACPRNLIDMQPESTLFQVLCSSQDDPKVKRKTCKVACIGCKLCAKQAPESYVMDGTVARIKADTYDEEEADKGALACSTQAIIDGTRFRPELWVTDRAARVMYKEVQAEEKKKAAAEKKRLAEEKKAQSVQASDNTSSSEEKQS